MTVCVGAKLLDAEGNVKAVRIATDSQVSLSSRRMVGISKSCFKAIEFPGAVVAASGSGCVFEALSILKNDQKFIDKVQFRNRDDVRLFAADFCEEFNTLLDGAPCEKSDTQMGVLLVATDNALYSVYSDRSVFEHDWFNTSGSGGEMADILMWAYYEDYLTPESTEEDLEALLTKVITKVCEREDGCGLPCVIYKPSGANPLLTKKSRKKKLTNPAPNGKITSEEGVTKRANKKRAK